MQQDPQKTESLQAAIGALKANRPLRAEELCRDYLSLRPGSAEHIRLLAHALMKQNRLPESEEQIRFALDLRPNQPQLHEDLGSVLALQGRVADAIPFFEKAIELDPSLPQAHKKLGRALAAMGRGDEADESFMEYFDRDPETGEVAVGADHLKAGRVDEAIEALRGVIRQHPENVDALCFLALAYRQKDSHWEDAEALLRRATQLAPDHVSAWLNLGSVLAERNKRLDAVDAYRQATRIEPGHAGAWALLGNAHAHASQTDLAAHAYGNSGRELLLRVALAPGDRPDFQAASADVGGGRRGAQSG